MGRPRRLSTEDNVTELLDEIFGAKPSHRNIADELVTKYSDARGSLLSVLRFLVYYKSEGQL